MKKKINIGIDIGITSVGWSIIDEQNNIIDLGVRLFDDPASIMSGKLKNQERRQARLQRRRINRIRYRKDRLFALLIDYGYINDIDEFYEILESSVRKYSNFDNPIPLKVYALENKISKEELVIILFHYIHHRGFSYLLAENSDKTLANDGRFPSVQMNEFYMKNGWYKGCDLSQAFSKNDYKEEIVTILNKQNVNSEFKDKYIELFNKTRHFSEGPGSEKSPTPFGRWSIVNGEKIYKGENLWDATVGKCTFYKDENRAAKYCPIAEIYNLISDLNNLYTKGNKENKLSKEIKLELFRNISKKWQKNVSKKSITLKEVIKTINDYLDDIEKLDEKSLDDINGYRTDKKLTEIGNYQNIAKFLLENKVINSQDFDLLDVNNLLICNEFYNIIRINVIDVISQVNSILENDKFKKISKEKLYEFLSKFDFRTSKTHSLSEKAMIEYIKTAIHEPINQRQFFDDKFKFLNEPQVNKSKYISKEFLKDMIISPTTKRALTQAINVINKIIKFYGDEYSLNNVTIEMPREKNSKEEKDIIKKQNSNRKALIKKIENDFNINTEKKAYLRKKIKLYYEQDGIDLYDQKPIDIQDLIKNEQNYVIDHIIPISVCFIDGFKNKVLTKAYLNANKGSKTPYQWLKQIGKYDSFKEKVNSISSISETKKKDFLLYENNPINDLFGFIERNLVDTRYASSEFLHRIQNFKNINSEIYPDLKVKIINGSMTSFVRYSLTKLQKDRDMYYHHAVDATIVNFLGNNYKINQLCNFIYMESKKLKQKNSEDSEKIEILNSDTGDSFSLYYDIKKELSDNDIISKLRTQLLSRIENRQIKFSRQLTRRKNVNLSDDTVHSFLWKDDDRKEGNLIDKLNLLNEIPNKDKEKDKLSKYFGNKAIEKEKLFIYKWDRKMYEKLNSIYNTYIGIDPLINPFINYMKTEFNNDNPKNIIIDDKYIKKLKILGDNKSSNSIINLDKKIMDNKYCSKKKRSSKSKYSSVKINLNFIELRIYKNINDVYRLIPINQKVLMFDKKKRILKINEEKLNEVLLSYNIKNHNFIKINNGTVFIRKDNNELFFSNGGGNVNDNRLELKCLFETNEKYGWRRQMQISLSRIISEYDICEVDELGNIYNRRSINFS